MDSKNEIYTHKVRAGKRTYFFDVKVTRSSDHYIVITESKRVSETDYEKHKVFIYREDFEKIVEALRDCVEFVETEFPLPEPGNNTDETEN